MDLSYYLESTDAAAKRTRLSVIVLVVACVLVAVSLLNSYQNSWIHQRIRTLADKKAYAAYKLGYASTPDETFQPTAEQQTSIDEFSRCLICAYVERSFVIKVPFFGVAFDMNDLGLLAGFGLIVLLAILLYNLRSEIVSLRVGFDAARQRDQLGSFYDVLASRRVFTTPILREPFHVPARAALMVHLPRAIVFLPLLAYGALLYNDVRTIIVGIAISPAHTLVLIIYTTAFFILISALSVVSWIRWTQIDMIWDECWAELNPSASGGRRV